MGVGMAWLFAWISGDRCSCWHRRGGWNLIFVFAIRWKKRIRSDQMGAAYLEVHPFVRCICIPADGYIYLFGTIECDWFITVVGKSMYLLYCSSARRFGEIWKACCRTGLVWWWRRLVPEGGCKAQQKQQKQQYLLVQQAKDAWQGTATFRWQQRELVVVTISY